MEEKKKALSEQELDAVSGGGCSESGGNAPAQEPQLYPGQKVYLKNSGHTFGSQYCQNSVCAGHVYTVVKQINDTDTYLIECIGCGWTYHAVKDNIIIP